MDGTRKFSGLADVYARGRPSYAEALLEALYTRYGFSERSVVGDIGSGTGKFARQLLDRGSFVYCVEPNGDMRAAAGRELAAYPNCRIVDGTADSTTLADGSVDFVTAAQAFHWFDPHAFQKECGRILKKEGKALLIWNMRGMTDPVNQACFEIFRRYCPAFQGFGGGIQRDDIRIRQFFGGSYTYMEYENPLCYDRVRFISRSLSGSYSLRPGDKDYASYLEALTELFDRYARNKVLCIPNKTVAYMGRPGNGE